MKGKIWFQVIASLFTVATTGYMFFRIGRLPAGTLPVWMTICITAIALVMASLAILTFCRAISHENPLGSHLMIWPSVFLVKVPGLAQRGAFTETWLFLGLATAVLVFVLAVFIIEERSRRRENQASGTLTVP